MQPATGSVHGQDQVRAMFSRIAPRYDLLNRLMTLGQDGRWRRTAVGELQIEAGACILDLGAGTGDLAAEILQQHPQARVVAADFSQEMIAVGRQHADGSEPHWVVADAHNLPFAGGTFSGVICGFLLRNVADLERTLRQIERVLQPEGRFVCLETSPAAGLLKPVLLLHLRVVIPMLGALLGRDAGAYRYLAASTQEFLSPPELAARLEHAGLHDVRYQRFAFGTIAVHSGAKP